MSIEKRIDGYQDEMIESLRRLLKHNSIKGEATADAPQGEAVAACLKEALSLGKELGFETKDVDGWAGEISLGQGEDYVAILGHLDIVPAGNDWTFDPFAGEVSQGKIYGRGTNDDKGPVIAALYALKALKDEGVELGSAVRVILGTCEETGGPDIENYLKQTNQPKAGFTPDASFPAIHAEKGIVNATLTKEIRPRNIKIQELAGGNAPNMVPDLAKLTYVEDGESNEITLKGVSAHGSTPEKGDNAILKMFQHLGQLDSGLKEEMDFLIQAFSDVNGAKMDLPLKDESGPLTCNLGVLEYEEGKISLTLNFRVPVTFTKEDVAGPLKLFFGARDWEVSMTEFTEPLYYPKDLPMIETLMDSYRHYTGDEAEAIAIGGGTYAKTMDNVVAFGPTLPGREDVDHIADEYVAIEDMMLWTKIYAKAIKDLTNL